MNKSFVLLMAILVVLSIYGGVALAWNDDMTHRHISEYAAEVSILGKTSGDYLQNIGFKNGVDEDLTWENSNKKIRAWIRDGAFYEDYGTRWRNHFHNPLQPWVTAGLSDLWSGQSALLWAQSYNDSQQPMADDWSWQRTRKLYNLALTSSDPAVRSAFFAETFRGLGQQMHLLQDMAVPAHVRNDAHPLDPLVGTNGHGHYFETWVKENKPDLTKLKAFAPNPVIPQVVFSAPTDNGVAYSTLSPITQLFDTNQYVGTNPSTGSNVGLAEYTNANYFSDDTIGMPGIWTSSDHTFPHPSASDTNLQDYINSIPTTTTVIAEDGVADVGIWIKKTGDEPVEFFVKPGYLSKPLYETIGGGFVYERTFYLDDKCHENYAANLLPRAVGYSASLLNYFFRGKVEFIGAEELVSNNTITGVNLRVRNQTIDEEMRDGEVRLAYRYKPQGAAAFTYGVSDPIASGTLAYQAETSYAFNFPTPIPYTASDVQYTWVFRGTLGQETGAVAAKVFPGGVPGEDWELGFTGRHQWTIIPIDSSTVTAGTTAAPGMTIQNAVVEFKAAVYISFIGDFPLAELDLNGTEGPDRGIRTDDFPVVKTAYYILNREYPVEPTVYISLQDPITGASTGQYLSPFGSAHSGWNPMYAVLPPGYIVKRIEIGASFNTSSVSRSQTFDILVDDVVFAVPGSNIYLSH